MAKIYTKHVIILYMILIIKFKVDAASLNAGKNKSDTVDGLYSLDDKVNILNADNLKENVNGKPYVNVVEFYSSWCGHCQRFAPYWKDFAKAVNHWRDIVLISAIDCSDEKNTPMCREFDVMGYPSVRFFHVNYETREKNFGEVMKVHHDVEKLKQSLVINLIEEQKNDRGAGWPLLTGYNSPHIEGVWDNLPTSVKYVFLVVDKTDSYLGAEIILDTHIIPEISVKVVNENTELATLLGVTIFPSLIVVDRDLKTTALTPKETNKRYFEKAIKEFCESRSIEWPNELDLDDYNIVADKPNGPKNQSEIDLIHKISEMGDVVFQIDLENALHYSLKTEISKMNVISGPSLSALRNFLTVLTKYFPFRKNGIDFLKSLKNKVYSVEEISGADFSKYVSESEDSLQPVYSAPLQWLGCRGSLQRYRGYPCGVWTMFHYLTVNSVEQNAGNNEFDSKEVLDAMLGFVKHFFGCQHCSQHFQEMALRRNLDGVSGPDQSILWLWRAHNEVNERLSGDPTEDPLHPKIQYPGKSRCPQCYSSVDDKWVESEVLRYLRKVYIKDNIKYFVNPEDRSEMRSSGNKNLWNSLSKYDTLLPLHNSFIKVSTKASIA